VTSPRTRARQTAIHDLTRHTGHDFDAAVKRIMDARPALPGAGGGGNGRSKGSHADPTLALACKPDRVAPEVAELDRRLKRLVHDAAWVAGFVARWTPHHPTDRDRREVEAANTADPMCEYCTPHRREGDAQEVHRTGTVAGNLPHPMALCRWCYDRVRSDGRLPNGDRLARLKSFKADAVRV